jgi:hypothetical protein
VTLHKMKGILISISWFGSSGGGLPRRPGLEKVEGAFSFVPALSGNDYPAIPGRTDNIRQSQVWNTDKVQPPGALFWLLTNGVVRRGMPVWSKLPEPQRWQLVSFIESLTPAPQSKPYRQETPQP